MLRELWAMLIDAVHEGDLRGRLVCWWAVATGKVTPETRAGAVTGQEGAK